MVSSQQPTHWAASATVRSCSTRAPDIRRRLVREAVGSALTRRSKPPAPAGGSSVICLSCSMVARMAFSFTPTEVPARIQIPSVLVLPTCLYLTLLSDDTRVGLDCQPLLETDMPPDRETIARNLRTARENRGLSQHAVAKNLGFSRTLVAMVELGNRPVTDEELLQFASVYGRTLVELKGAQVSEDEDPVTTALLKIAPE